MKTKVILIMIFALIFSGCDLISPEALDPGSVEAPAVAVEEEESPAEEAAVESQLADSPEEEAPAQEPQEEEGPPVVEPVLGEALEAGVLCIEVLQGPGSFIDGFVEIGPDDHNLSYIERPIFHGPTNLANFWNQEVYDRFYGQAMEDWEHIIQVQTSLDQGDEFKNYTVFRVQTSVFEDSNNLVLLGRRVAVYGYSMVTRDSAVFYIDRITGDEVEPADQLARYGKTMEEALTTLKLFQDDNSQIPFEDLSADERLALFEEGEAIQYNMAQLYGSDKPVILNDFRSAHAPLKTDVFITVIGGREYYVVKLLLASLEENMLDGSYRDDIWIGLSVDYDGGVLQREDYYPGSLDAIYR
ncbi:MAG: hypothetical protein GX046_02885 [Tissierellia bacterium]|nr:hypothetical protein [Tissierellia bacterium]